MKVDTEHVARARWLSALRVPHEVVALLEAKGCADYNECTLIDTEIRIDIPCKGSKGKLAYTAVFHLPTKDPAISTKIEGFWTTMPRPVLLEQDEGWRELRDRLSAVCNGMGTDAFSTKILKLLPFVRLSYK